LSRIAADQNQFAIPIDFEKEHLAIARRTGQLGINSIAESAFMGLRVVLGLGFGSCQHQCIVNLIFDSLLCFYDCVQIFPFLFG
jgi:hypothetical protein